MNYLEIYHRRINHLGETTAERIKNGGERSFYKWMAESPFTVNGLSVERGLYFDGIIQTNKDKEHEKIMFLYVANDIPLLVGDIMNWELNLDTTEKWLLVQEEKKVNGTYRTFWIVRCNYLMKWVDNKGHLQQSWSYFVSSLDSKIKNNYRTWHNLISPQPNKYAELLLPTYPIERSTNFIVENESWQVVEYDHTSVPGVMYISLTEGKINSIYDDVEQNIADTDKLAKYQLSTPSEIQNFSIGAPINPVFTLMKDGHPNNSEVEFIPQNKKVARIVNGVLTAVGNGTSEIIVRLKEYPQIQCSLTVKISDDVQEFDGYIDGADSIKLSYEESYTLKGFNQIQGEVLFEVEDTEYGDIVKQKTLANYCVIKANEKNKLGTIILKAIYQNKTYIKEIQVIPLW